MEAINTCTIEPNLPKYTDLVYNKYPTYSHLTTLHWLISISFLPQRNSCRTSRPPRRLRSTSIRRLHRPRQPLQPVPQEGLSLPLQPSSGRPVCCSRSGPSIRKHRAATTNNCNTHPNLSRNNNPLAPHLLYVYVPGRWNCSTTTDNTTTTTTITTYYYYCHRFSLLDLYVSLITVWAWGPGRGRTGISHGRGIPSDGSSPSVCT